MLDKLELIGELATEDQVIFSVFIVASYFFNDQTLVIFIYGDSSYDTVYLCAFCVKVNLTLLIENGLLTVGAKVNELVFVNE